MGVNIIARAYVKRQRGGQRTVLAPVRHILQELERVGRLGFWKEGVDGVDKVVEKRRMMVDGRFVLGEEVVPASRDEPQVAERLEREVGDDAQDELCGEGF